MATGVEESTDACNSNTAPEKSSGNSDLRGLANATRTPSTSAATQNLTRQSSQQSLVGHEKFVEMVSNAFTVAQKALTISQERALELAREQAQSMQGLELQVSSLAVENDKLRQRLADLGEPTEPQDSQGSGNDTPSPKQCDDARTWNGCGCRSDNAGLSVASTTCPYDLHGSAKTCDIVLPGMVDWKEIDTKDEAEKPLQKGSTRRSNSTFQVLSSEMNNEELKKEIRRKITSKKIDAGSFYKDNSIFATIAKSQTFEKLSLFVVTLNAIWVGIDTDWNDADFLFNAHPVFIIAENLFCVAFTLEWVIRFIAFEKKRNMIKDNWYMFDTFLVTVMVIETWLMPVVVVALGADGAQGGANASVLRVVRLFRLTRMARVARVLRAMPELIIMVKALKSATRSVFFTLVLLAMLLYVFGVTFAQLCDDSDVGRDMYSSVLHAMYSLLLYGVLCLDFLGEMAEDLNKVAFYMPVLLFLFVLLSALTVMNMLIGVLCEVVNTVARTENETNLIENTRCKVMKVLESLDEDGNAMLSKEEFLQILEHPQACRAFLDVGIDVISLVDLANTIFWDQLAQREVELSFEDFLDRVLKLRDSNQATVKDIHSLARIIHTSDVRIAEIADMMAKDLPSRPTSPTPVKGAGKIGPPPELPRHLPSEMPRNLELNGAEKID